MRFPLLPEAGASPSLSQGEKKSGRETFTKAVLRFLSLGERAEFRRLSCVCVPRDWTSARPDVDRGRLC